MVKKFFILFLIPILGNCQRTSVYVTPQPIQPTVVDSFTAANGTSISARNTDSGDSWTIANGSLVINSNAVNANVFTTNCMAWIDKGWTNVILKATITSTLGNDQVGFILRYVDNNNYYRLVFYNTGNNFRLYSMIGGVETLIAFSNILAIEGNFMVTLNGDLLQANIGGNSGTVIGTLTQLQGSTKHGIFLYKPSATNSVTLDNFKMWQYAPQEPPDVATKITLTNGVDYQPYQRFSSVSSVNKIFVSGRINDASPHDIEASWNGGAYQTIARCQANGFFTGELTGLGQGQGDLIVRFKDNTSVSVTSKYVSITDIFFLAGQSNCAGEGTNFQVYSGSYRAVLFDNQYRYRNLVDPVGSYVAYVDPAMSVASPNAIGSYWPLVATSFMSWTNVPFAAISGAAGGTAISQWAKGSNPVDRTTLFGSMIYRIKQQPYGIKAVIWHQGESDALINGFTGRTLYATKINQLATDVWNNVGVPIVVCRIHTWSGAPSTTPQNVIDINAAMSDAAAINSHILIGPDYNNPTSVTSGLHLTLDSELADAANRFWTSLKTLFY